MEPIFTWSEGKGFVAAITGRMLNEARTENISIPLEGGGSASLTDTRWYDHNNLDKDFGSIKNMEFDRDAIYLVYYFTVQVQTKYMLAIKLAS